MVAKKFACDQCGFETDGLEEVASHPCGAEKYIPSGSLDGCKGLGHDCEAGTNQGQAVAKKCRDLADEEKYIHVTCQYQEGYNDAVRNIKGAIEKEFDL